MKDILIKGDKKRPVTFIVLFSKIVVIVLLSAVAVSCKKNQELDLNKSDDGLRGSIASGTWQLTSATNFNASGIVTNRYIGIKADTVLFMWGKDQYWNLVLTNINSFIGGSNRLMAYSMPIVPESYAQKRIGLILTSPGWKDGYSDTLSVTYYSDYYLVFNVKDSIHGGYEMDSLKRIHIGG